MPVLDLCTHPRPASRGVSARESKKTQALTLLAARVHQDAPLAGSAFTPRLTLLALAFPFLYAE